MERFRKGIVAVIRNGEGKVLIGERSDYPGTWQFPQGGIEPGETPKDAFYRELREEIGNDGCRILLQAEKTTTYRWSEPGREGKVGQEHFWFLAEFEPGNEPNLSKSDGCFSTWKWEEPGAVIPLLFDIKREPFREGLRMLGLLP